MVLSHPGLIAAAGPAVTAPDGRSVVWADWVGENSPVAVVLWASWVPDAAATLEGFDSIAGAARSHDLDVVLIVVQESFAEARESLGGTDIRWFHDRFGHLLKEYRVVSIPRVLILSEDGTVIENLEAKPDAIRAWGGG